MAKEREKERKRGRDGETERENGRMAALRSRETNDLPNFFIPIGAVRARVFRQRFASKVANRRGRLRTFLYAAIDLIFKNVDMVKISQSFYGYSGCGTESD